MRRGLILVAGLLLALTSCGEESSMAASPKGKTYLSTAVTEGGKPKQLVPNTRIRLELEDDGELNANAGCNSLLGSYSIKDNTLAVDGPLGGTEMGCPPPLQAQDEWLKKFLVSKPTWALNGDRLELTSGSTTISLLDRTVAEPDLPLTGTRWTLASVVTGDAHAHYSDTTKAWITITGNRLTGSTGCNDLHGTVSHTTAKLTFTDIITTDRACTGDPALIEKAILATLKGTVSYEIDAKRLSLRTPDKNGIDFTGNR